jgi:myo-inositol-1(or 4)-monophosphatase
MPTGDQTPGRATEPVIDRTLADAVLALCREVGARQTAAFRQGSPGGGAHKLDGSLLSDVDRDSELALRDGLAALLPEAGFLGEELGRSGREDLCWIVDPLDGTTNFLSGLGTFAISVALVRDGIGVLGVVHAPVLDESFLGLRGGGAWRNGRRLDPVQPLPLTQAVIAVGLPVVQSPAERAAVLERMGTIWAAARDLRSLGCAALELCHVAAGDLQGFWELRLKPWDCAAATVLLAETGCGVADAAGRPHALLGADGICAGHPDAFDALLAIIAGAPADPTEPNGGRR